MEKTDIILIDPMDTIQRLYTLRTILFPTGREHYRDYEPEFGDLMENINDLEIDIMETMGITTFELIKLTIDFEEMTIQIYGRNSNGEFHQITELLSPSSELDQYRDGTRILIGKFYNTTDFNFRTEYRHWIKDMMERLQKDLMTNKILFLYTE